MSGYQSSFSPYQPPPDERTPRSTSVKYSPVPSHSAGGVGGTSNGGAANPFAYQSNNASSSSAAASSSSSAVPPGFETVRINKYETRLPIRVDIEAALCYVLGCISGVFFLILEQQNDYVRFHAWQSSLLGVGLMAMHFIVMLISSFLTWLLLFFDVVLAIFLAYRAYKDGETLDRYQLPIVGPLAARWVDSE